MKTKYAGMMKTMTEYMKNEQRGFAGVRVPQTREVSYDCPVHGKQVYTTYQRPDGSWLPEYCPLCKKEADANANAIREIQSEAAERVIELSRALGIGKPDDWEGPTLDNYVPETNEEAHNLKVCRRFAERFTEREMERVRAHEAQEKDWRSKNAVGLAFLGNYGTGKTHLAYSILKSLEAQGVPGFYVTVPDLFDALTDFDNRVEIPRVMGKLTMVSCLVLDEVGVQSGSEYERKRLYQIIDGRIKNGRPTIFITNLGRDELNTLMTERIMSRIKASSYSLTFTGRSRRDAVKRTAEEMF